MYLWYSGGIHAMPPELCGKWRTKCLNIRFPLPTLLCTGYSVKQKESYVTNIIKNIFCILNKEIDKYVTETDSNVIIICTFFSFTLYPIHSIRWADRI